MKTEFKTIDKLIEELTEEDQPGQSCALQILTGLLMRLADTASEEDVYRIIGEALHTLVPDSVVSINSFEETSDLIYIKTIQGPNTHIDALTSILGKCPAGMSFAINNEARRELSSGSLKKVPGGLYSLTMGNIPKSVCTVIEKLLDVGDIYAIGFTWKGQLLGSASFLLRREHNSINPDLMKTFVSLASIALQRWKAEDALWKSEQENKEILHRYNRIIQTSTDIIFTVDLDGNFRFTNKAFHDRLGYSKNEIKRINGFQLVHPDDLNRVKQQFSSLIKGESIQDLEYRYKMKDRSYMTILNSSYPMFDSEGNVVGALGILRNISRRKKLEDELRVNHHNMEKLVAKRARELELMNRKLQRELYERKNAEEEARQSRQQLDNLQATAPVIMCRLDLKGKVLYVNKKFEEVTGYSKDEIVGKYWPRLGLMPTDTGALIRRMKKKLLGKPASPMEVTIRCKDGQLKYVSGIGELIRENGRLIGFQVIAQDITQRKLAEKQAEGSTRRLLKALGDMVEAMAITVELRDPYTAGHQRRVAQLACAIAKDMGLSEDQLRGIRFAGIIHDIGKIRVPSEILTHPNGLTEAEMGIIRTHPLVGYEILKNIEFPWPIAQAVLQHHERINGSGYPSGLLNEDIIVEAKILAVADVVEAMASHRPYRPSLGIDQALDEIKTNRGKLYDPVAVDSCVKLFNKKGFKLEKVSTIET